MKDTSDDVALSEVIGFVLLLGLVVAALSLYMVYVVPISGREDEITQLNRINEQFTDYKFTLDNIRTSVHVNNLSPVMTSTSFNLGTGGGNTQAGGFFLYMAQPASSSATLSINTTGDTFNIDSSSYHNSMGDKGEFPINITALEYRSNNNYWIQQKYSYQLGGVFLSQDDGITNRISPLISFANTSNNSVVVNIAPVQVVGGGSLSGNGPARVDTRLRILPKYNISTDPYVSNTWVNISVTSADYTTAAMWLNIFNDTAIREQLALTAYKSGISPPGSKPTTAFINITGTNSDPNWKDVSLYVQRAEFYVAFNNIASESGITPTPTPTTTTTTTVTPTPTPPPAPTPTFVSIAPSSGLTAGGTGVTITGTNLIGATAVTFGGTAATGISVVSSTSITATTPAHAAGAVNVVITTPNGTATGTNAYTYVSPPTFTSISPNSGPTTGDTAVTIAGTDFVSGGSFGVTIGGAAAANVVWTSSTQITAVTPVGTTGAKDVVITNNDGQTATGTNAYTYLAPAPTVTAITPNSGTRGTTVSITDLAGTNFVVGTTPTVQLTGGTTVTASSVVVSSSTKITCTFTLPGGGSSGTYNVVVTNTDGQSGTLTGGFTITK